MPALRHGVGHLHLLQLPQREHGVVGAAGKFALRLSRRQEPGDGLLRRQGIAVEGDEMGAGGVKPAVHGGVRHGDHPLVVGESDPEIVAGLLDASLLSLQLAVHKHQVPLPQIEPIVVVGQRPVLCREIDLHHGLPGRGLLRGSAQTSPDLWSDSEINPILNAMAFPSFFLCSHSAASGVRKNGLASVFSPGLLYTPAFSAV